MQIYCIDRLEICIKVIKMYQVRDMKPHRKLTLIHHIWMAIMQMDADYLDELLDDDLEYEDVSKGEFIEKLRSRFIDHLVQGDTELYMDLSTCLGCQCNSPVCKFIGNNTGEHFALYFELDGEEILDIYHCNLYNS